MSESCGHTEHRTHPLTGGLVGKTDRVTGTGHAWEPCSADLPGATAAVVLLRTQSVLELKHVFAEHVEFSNEGEEEGYNPINLRLSKQPWADMGHPVEITVSVQPGNTLQETYEEETPKGRV